jgi:hypothetical protein
MLNFNIKDYMTVLLPTGSYRVIVKAIELKEDKGFLLVKFEIISDFKKGKRLVDVFNIFHVKDDVKELAREKLAKLAVAAKLEDLKNIHELIDKIVEVDVSDYYKNGESKNKIDKYKICPLENLHPDADYGTVADGYSQLMSNSAPEDGVPF